MRRHRAGIRVKALGVTAVTSSRKNAVKRMMSGRDYEEISPSRKG